MGDGTVQPKKPASPAGAGAEIEIFENWAYIEADFQREYDINLMLELPKMSWRRFIVLLRGLGPNSTFVLISAIEEKTAEEDPAVSKPINNKQALKTIAGW